MTTLKDVSLSTGAGTPTPLGAYPANPRPAKDAAPTQGPRDNGGLSTGTTAGNFMPNGGRK